ncbi:hypothetical protein TDSAC_1492 [Thermodesulfobium acidiphilum]|uniref:Lin0512 family protein n=1 Tax=Thermodesulfobium acidiphilum TaxID=1794699 RepID=A0A2R4W1Z7_THEAF|nr:Lin0512 family protein [Thermodesulfobium acidiphilum]AWB10831.1 hypothetical protein TDSAC_1492 [Thermodesulfobium acidiphilum]
MKKRLLIEMGMGVDQHGQSPTKAAIKAIKNAIQNVYITGLIEIFNIKNLNEIEIVAELAAPRPEEVNIEEVKKAFPIQGNIEIIVKEGGMSIKALKIEELKDISNEVIICCAAVSVFVNVN